MQALVIISAAAWCAMALRTAGAACEDVKQVVHELILMAFQCWFVSVMFVFQLQGRNKRLTGLRQQEHTRQKC
jgi:hypothetical protein